MLTQTLHAPGDNNPVALVVPSSVTRLHGTLSANCHDVPTGNSCTATIGGLFDHLVGAAEQCRGDIDAGCLGGIEVDDQLNVCRLHAPARVGSGAWSKRQMRRARQFPGGATRLGELPR